MFAVVHQICSALPIVHNEVRDFFEHLPQKATIIAQDHLFNLYRKISQPFSVVLLIKLEKY